MPVLVVGSVAYDSVVTSAGSRSDILGGSATFFAISCSYFTAVSLVAVVGKDFQIHDMKLLQSHGVDISGLDTMPGKTFRWSGVYSFGNVNIRETLDTQLNVFADFSPTLNEHHQTAPFLFLANIDPALQLKILSQMTKKPKMVALDTMNFWIHGKNEQLKGILQKVDVLFIDEGEARDLANTVNLVQCAEIIAALGPKTIVIKRGEHGIIMFHENSMFAIPAFPVKNVIDPTGAGDAFAGGFLGHIAATGDFSHQNIRKAAVIGSVMGSFAVEQFSLDGIRYLCETDIKDRFLALKNLTEFATWDTKDLLPLRDEVSKH